MSSKSTRREFLQRTAAGVSATTLLSASLPAMAAAPGETAVWVTAGDKRFARSMPLTWKAGKASSSAISLNPDKKFQEILGFGAAFTEAACYTLHRIPTDARAQLLHELFDPSEMAFSVCRTCIGSSDYATKLYSYNDGDVDPGLTRFSIEHDRADVLPILHEARKVNPDLFLFSSPWSPPGWMKANNSMLGGAMQRKHMPSYANYFVKFLQAYESEGVPVQAVTVQNEVDTEQDGRMPACTWPQEYEADFVRQNLGPLFQKSGVQTQIWMIDHNYNLWGRALSVLEMPDLRRFTNTIAWHGYVGKPEWMSRVHNAYPEVAMYWTEGGPDYTDPHYADDWATWSKTFTGILQNWCRSITAWNFALDEKGRPNIGPFSCGGLVTVDSQSKKISHSGQYWAFAHYSRLVKRGAKRIESQSSAKDVEHIAFENPDGQRVLVLTNSGPEKDATIAMSGHTASIELEPNSVTTVAWK